MPRREVLKVERVPVFLEALAAGRVPCLQHRLVEKLVQDAANGAVHVGGYVCGKGLALSTVSKSTIKETASRLLQD